MPKNKHKQKQTSIETPVNLSVSKKRIFSIIIVSLPVLFFIILEILLRVSNYGGNQDLFISAPLEVSNYKMINRDVANRFFFLQNTRPSPSKDLFLKQKPKNGYRIFVMGESTTAGFPYGNNVMFPRILHHRLADVFPDRRIEVVNTAMAAVSSYTFIDTIDEILANEPDAILIYAGHNEFYGALGVASTETLGKVQSLVKLYLKLQRFRTFLLVRNFVGKIRSLAGATIDGDQQVDPSATLMERIVADQKILLNSELYKLGKDQFETNLREILRKSQKASVPVVLSELVSNVRDLKPFESMQSDSLPPAIQVYEMAQALATQNKFTEAGAAFTRAKDLDALRFRATEEFNGIIHKMASDFNAPVVPMLRYFQEASANGLIGDELMLDHLHPNRRGYFLMADVFLNTLKENRLIAENWDESRIRPASFYYTNWGFTDLDSIDAAYKIQHLKAGWPFKPHSEKNTVLAEIAPKNQVERLAFKQLVDKDFSLETAHLKLAEYYEEKNEYDLAFEEYKALYHIIPFETMFYERAAKMLFELKRFDAALPILLDSYQVRESSFTVKWIGQILLQQGRVNEAFPYLERAQQLLPYDTQLLYNLARAYKQNGFTDKFQSAVKTLQQVSPNSPFLASLIDDRPTELAHSEGVNEYLEQARDYLRNKQFEQALPLLYESLKIEETAAANKMIGQILLTERKLDEGVQYLEKAKNLAPDDQQLLYNLSSAYLVQKDIAKAVKTYDELMFLNPNFPDPSNLKKQFARFGKIEDRR